ncbi:MAG: carboxymuconolactone decarboxylase [Bradyrhizobium sp.]|jgi:alkylhydroperoxidase family enzyme|nr:carboxymuconolactone decarboxylase [Bradyrhizobium sp.]
MPRIRQTSLSEAHPKAQAYFRKVFGDKDPAVSPGTVTGTPGHWFTSLALRPYVFDHALGLIEMRGMLGAAPTPSQLDPQAREVALARTGWAVQSQFIFSGECKIARMVGLTPEQVAAIPAWNVADVWTPLQRAILAYTDSIVLEHGRVAEGVVDALKAHMSDEDIMELTYHIVGTMSQGIFAKALRLEYDDIDDRIVELAMPGGGDFAKLEAARQKEGAAAPS